MNYFSQSPKELFFSKNDPFDKRLGDLFIQKNSIEQVNDSSFCILGYPDDEGISLNGGRVGAQLAPDKIRQFLYKMTPSLNLSKYGYFDIGNLKTDDLTLEERHQVGRDAVFNLMKKNTKTISFGGGHDYGYSDVGGFLKKFTLDGARPMVINFDAHLDVRPTNNGFNSGTPFYRLLTEFENQFDFAEVGIQPQCNSSTHRDWALHKKASIFNLSEIEKNGGLNSLLKHPLFEKLNTQTPVFISFDIDCLKSAEAPGCSQSWPTGLSIQDLISFFQKLKRKASVYGIGIYEVSPPLDVHDLTSKSAALIAYHYMFEA